ncbi:MAG TPA: polysaccharide deacetylase family protein, partial [Gaiellaceae bacterium]|nr:polysaccharide deacetylase family protein [Gaiellaceae bacterium]
IAADGHLVGSHSFCHAHLRAFSPLGLRRDIRDAEQAILATTGADPRPWFRCPYGDGWDDPEVRSAIEELGYRHVGWHVVLGDWESKRTPAALREALDHGLRRCDGEAVVLLHSWPEATIGALPAMLGALRERGVTLVRLDGLERVPEAVVF